jgi:hypothetical protein
MRRHLLLLQPATLHPKLAQKQEMGQREGPTKGGWGVEIDIYQLFSKNNVLVVSAASCHRDGALESL